MSTACVCTHVYVCFSHDESENGPLWATNISGQRKNIYAAFVTTNCPCFPVFPCEALLTSRSSGTICLEPESAPHWKGGTTLLPFCLFSFS